jgi:ubiquinone/menaquinone biosynthesis C-methylase UbiE
MGPTRLEVAATAAAASGQPLVGASAADPTGEAYGGRGCPALTDVAVVILTLNEEDNLPSALESVSGWARETFVVDSFSKDRTVEIASEAGCVVIQHPFVDHASQRNFAIHALPYTASWILFLDADERLTPELKTEISRVLASAPAENGYYIKRRMYWMGRWIRHGYYPAWILRLFRRGTGRCEDRPVNEHLIVDGAIGYLQSDFVHEDHKGIGQWIIKHERYASLEAAELIRREGGVDQTEIRANLFGTQAERTRWIRHRIWNRLPVLVRPFLYFFYRLVVRGGFLDGSRAFAYHFLQGLWFPILIDLKYLELRDRRSSRSSADAVAWHDAQAHRFNERYEFSSRFRERLKVWRDVLSKSLKPNESVIDIGCGPGHITAVAACFAGRVVGIDGSPSMIELAQSRAKRAGISNIDFLTARFEHGVTLPITEADALVCSSILEYIDDQDAFFQAWSPIVRPGGTIFLSVPRGGSWYRLLEKISFRLFRRPRYYENVKHVDTVDAWKDRLTRYGFQVSETLYFGAVPYLGRLLGRIGPRPHGNTMVLIVAKRRERRG